MGEEKTGCRRRIFCTNRSRVPKCHFGHLIFLWWKFETRLFKWMSSPQFNTYLSDHLSSSSTFQTLGINKKFLNSIKRPDRQTHSHGKKYQKKNLKGNRTEHFCPKSQPPFRPSFRQEENPKTKQRSLPSPSDFTLRYCSTTAGHFYSLRSDPKRCVRKCRQRGGREGRGGELSRRLLSKSSLSAVRARTLSSPLEIRSRRLVCHKRPQTQWPPVGGGRPSSPVCVY